MFFLKKFAILISSNIVNYETKQTNRNLNFMKLSY